MSKKTYRVTLNVNERLNGKSYTIGHIEQTVKADNKPEAVKNAKAVASRRLFLSNYVTEEI